MFATSIGGGAIWLKAGMVFIAGKLYDPCLSALNWFVYHVRRYTSARLFLTTKYGPDK